MQIWFDSVSHGLYEARWDGTSMIPVGLQHEYNAIQIASTDLTCKAVQDTFEGGITNGNEWYALFGGMQDWLYLRGGTLEVTLELSSKKWPIGDELHAVLETAKPAMLQYPLQALFGGVWGRVQAGGLPVRISVPSGGASFSAAPGTGTFFRALAPGNHTLVFSAEGKQAVERIVEVPADGSGIELNIDLGIVSKVPISPLHFPFPVIAGRTFRGKVIGAAESVPGNVQPLTGKAGSERGSRDAQIKRRRVSGNGKLLTRPPIAKLAGHAGSSVGEQSRGNTEHAGHRSFWTAGRWLLFVGGTGWLMWQMWTSGLAPTWCSRRRVGVRLADAWRHGSSV